MTRPIQLLLGTALASLLWLLAGCAAEQHYRSGQELLASNRTEEALRAYQEALQQEPTNARYRIAYLGARDKAVAAWLAEADRLRRRGESAAQVRALYLRVLGVEEGNYHAAAGLNEMERDERMADLLARAKAEQQRGNVELGLSYLRELLAERPQHGPALALRSQLQEQRNRPRAVADSRLAEAYRKPVSLEFRDVAVKQLFEVLSRSSGLNFVLDKDVRGDQRTTLFLRNTTVADALSLALLTNQLEQRVLDANTILVYPNTPAKLREYQPLSVKTFVLSVADAKAVGASLKTILKTRDIVIDEKQNMIVMRDSPEAILLAEKLVALHDQPEAEVMLDVEILEIKRSKLLQAGVQYPTQVALAPMASASGAALTLSDLRKLTSSTTSVSALSIGIQATDTVSDINVLANPRIRSRNREKAKIQVGQRVPNITSTSTSTGFVAESVQYVDVGLKLEVEPTVSPDGEVTIKMGLEVSSILRQIQTKAGSIAYEIGTRNANTVLRLRDGENQVLAGLINDEDRRSTTGIPGLSSIPILGRTMRGVIESTISDFW
jgi:general secretion pathway protein D